MADDGTPRRTLVTVGRLVATMLLLLVMAVGAAAWLVLFRSPTSVESGRAVQLEIPSGASTARIADILADAGVVANPQMMRVRARLLRADGSLKPGVYDLETGMSYAAAIERLVNGPPVAYVTVTIPEGFVVAQIAERLEEQVGIPQADTLALADGGIEHFVDDHPYLADAHRGSLEGFLFPKTYRIEEGSTAEQVLRMMLRQFDTELAQVDLEAARARGFDVVDLVTMASIIERETRLDRERPLVSSVIHNRLDKGMLLEIDATIEYVLPGTRFRLRYSDLRIDSPYNTYRYKGLPAGPISNPGLASLKAAASPAETDYLYYVLTDEDGSHTFTSNNKDHLKAKARSKEVFGR